MTILKLITRLKIKHEKTEIDLILDLLKEKDLHELIKHEQKIVEGIKNA